MLGVMGLPINKELADAASTTPVSVKMLSESAKVSSYFVIQYVL